MQISVTAFLKKVDIFQTVPDAALAKLAELLTVKDYPEDALIVEEGQVGDTFYLIQSGMVNITRGPSGARAFIASLAEGQHFGEAALFREVKRIANVEASSPTRLLALSRTAFENFLRDEPAAASQFLLQVVRQLLVRLEKTGSRLGVKSFDPLDASEIDACLSGRG